MDRTRIITAAMMVPITIAARSRSPAEAGSAIDPVCGMTVDPHTTPHRHTHQGQPYYFCSAGCRTQVRRRSGEYLAPNAASAPPGAGRRDLHLPDASRDPPGRTRRLPDLRHGARARAGERRERPQSRARRHDAAVLDRARARPCRWSCSRWAGISSDLHGVLGQTTSNWMQFVFATPVVLWAGWPFFVRGWQSLVTRNLNMFTLIAHGHRRRLRLQRGRDARARALSRRVPRP